MDELKNYRKQSIDIDLIGEIGNSISAIYRLSGIKIHSESGLSSCIQAAQDLSVSWKKGIRTGYDENKLALAMCCCRLGEELLLLEKEEWTTKRLRNLLNGDLLFFSSDRSVAKETEWEMNVLAHLRQGKAVATFFEPDVYISSSLGAIGIACKKINSEKQTIKRIKEGVEQIRKSGIPGVIALSLDSLIYDQKKPLILNARTVEVASIEVKTMIEKFLERNRDKIHAKCFSRNQISGVVFTMEAFCFIADSKEKYFRTRESIIWPNDKVNENKIHPARIVGDAFKKGLITVEETNLRNIRFAQN